jgi:hypothetical protein
MDWELAGGMLVTAVWAALLLWGLVNIALSARRRQMWPAVLYVWGMVGSCAVGIGVVLMFVAKNLLPYDVFGAGFLLAMSGGIVIWAVGYEASA